MKLKSIFFLLLACSFCLSAYSQSNKVLDNITSKLAVFTSENRLENAYLHFDKPYFAAGDTIYFKAYVTQGDKHQLTESSGVLHVELINPKNIIERSLKLQLVNGVAWGDFALADSLPPGNYRVRAFTHLMKNADDSWFFEQTISVGSFATVVSTKKVAKQTVKQNVNSSAQFFPEGGSLITGVPCKVAFKAINTAGLGVSAKGILSDNEGNEISSFVTSHLGMGYFMFTPTTNKLYTATVNFADGTKTMVGLPKSVDKGISLVINNTDITKASLKIVASKAYFEENQGKVFGLIIYTGGKANAISAKLDSMEIKMDVLKRRMPTGIATVTLFSPSGEPLAERLIFVQNYNQLNLNVDTDKKTYNKRDKVTIKLNAKDRANDPVMGQFSVSVVDESTVQIDPKEESTILSNLLLTSELKGYVEQANYYFADSSAKAIENLDILMLTQGYRRFEWKKIINNSYSPIAYKPENLLEISGQAQTVGGKPLVNAVVSLIPKMGGTMLTQITDEKGNFKFADLDFPDQSPYVLQAVSSNGNMHTKLSYFNDLEVVTPNRDPNKYVDDLNHSTMVPYMANRKKLNASILKYGGADGIMLNQIIVKGTYKTNSLLGAGNADQVIQMQDIKQSGSLINILQGRLQGVIFVGNTPYLNRNLAGYTLPPMLVVVDGLVLNKQTDTGARTEEPTNGHSPKPIMTDGGVGLDMNPRDIETIEVVKGANANIYGLNANGGVLIITSRLGGSKNYKDEISTGVLPIKAFGFYKAREFYVPNYQTNNNLVKPDLRTTIFWKPNIETDNKGNASFEYYNADGHGSYRITIEGIDDNGNIGRKTYRYMVK